MIIGGIEPIDEAIYDINSPFYLHSDYVLCEGEEPNFLKNIKKSLESIRLKAMEKKELKANADYGNCTSAFEKHLKDALTLEQENIRYFNKLVDDFIKDYNNYEHGSLKSYVANRKPIPDALVHPSSDAMAFGTNKFVKACEHSAKLRTETKSLFKKCDNGGVYYKEYTVFHDTIIAIDKKLKDAAARKNMSNAQNQNLNWLVDELKEYAQSGISFVSLINTVHATYHDIEKYFKQNESVVSFSGIYGIDENVKPVIDYSSIERSPLFNKVVNEYFDLSHRPTRQYLLGLDEAGQNAVITNLTSKLYDKIVKKCEDIDYGEIPNTKGDITKLSKYEDMKETIRILHDLLKEYKQDTGPVDELSVAFSNVETQKELFEKAYRYNTELPMVMYCNIVLAIITGISYMIATCVEFIKDPGTNTFQLALDRNSYRRTKDHTIYNTLRQFNKSCSKGDFDKAMNAVMSSQARSFAGAAVVGGVAIGAVATILVLIPILRELIFMFYYMRMRVSDFFDIQADLLTMNAYSIEANNEFTKQEKKEIIERQLKYVNNFRKIANAISFEVKKAEVEADKEKKSDDESKELIDDIGGVDTGSNGSALF